MKITPPNYTQTPNDLFDHWLPHLSEAELKVLLVIMRKTLGWHKVRDIISISQLSAITGLLEETVIKAAKTLQNKGVIIKQVTGPIGKQVTHYELVMHDNSNNSYPSVEPSGPLGLDPHGSTEAQKKETTKETIQKKQQHVVVKEEKIPPQKNKQLTEDYLYTQAVRLRKDWSAKEIEKAWKIYIECTYPISDPFAYIEGIINKARIIEKAKKEKEKCPASHMKNQKVQKKEADSSKNTSKTCKDPSSEKDMSERPLARSTLTNDPKKSLAAFLKERGISLCIAGIQESEKPTSALQ